LLGDIQDDGWFFPHLKACMIIFKHGVYRVIFDT
jgi:hypothetical protein